ncbi:MAG: helix-turn-helix domain-containing protein [Bacteroidales bacterium]
MPVGQQLELMIHELRITQSEFAKQTGLSKQTVNNIISGRHVTKSDVLEKILQAYPDLNITWLLNGKGNMWTTQPDSGKGKSRARQVQPQEGEKTYKELLREIEHLTEVIKLKDEMIELLRKL